MPKIFLWLSASMLLAITANTQAQTKPPSLSEAISSTELVLPDVRNLLRKMAQNSAHINYRGAFTYQNQTSIALQSFRIEHWVDNGVEHDRLMFLNGPEREILREGQPVDCNAMGDKLLQGSFMQQGNFTSQGGFTQIGKTIVNLDELYQFEIRSQERVAGRLARVLQVIPRDPYRYGYFLSIDEETGLVLKSWLIDENARPLERYQFVSIELNPDLNQLEHAKASVHQHKAIADITPCNPTIFTQPNLWQVAWVPQGFIFAGQRQLANGQTMLMYTDGLTTFSIFIEPTSTFVPEGVGQRGATLAYMSRLMYKNSIYRLSVVGEIPVAAAAKIAQNISGL